MKNFFKLGLLALAICLSLSIISCTNNSKTAENTDSLLVDTAITTDIPNTDSIGRRLTTGDNTTID